MNSKEKTQVCDYPGCGRAFFEKHSLLRHKTQKHGRPKTKHQSSFNTLSCPRLRDETDKNVSQPVHDEMYADHQVADLEAVSLDKEPDSETGGGGADLLM